MLYYSVIIITGNLQLKHIYAKLSKLKYYHDLFFNCVWYLYDENKQSEKIINDMYYDIPTISTLSSKIRAPIRKILLIKY